jgi:hypothetical protein
MLGTVAPAAELPPRGSRWRTGSASRGLDRFAGFVSYGLAGPSCAGGKARMQSTPWWLRRRAHWRGCPRAGVQIGALLDLAEQAELRCRRYRP